MQRFLIIATNCALLILLLIGLPAATRAQFGNLQVSSAATGQLLMFCGLGVAAAVNIFAVLILVKVRKQKILCWEWAVVFGALPGAEYVLVGGRFNFDWLEQTPPWLQKHF